jgi:hypothetical protein
VLSLLVKYGVPTQVSLGIPAPDAVLFTPTTGNLAGHAFLIVDENGVAGYQAGADVVIELTNATNLSHFSLSNFASSGLPTCRTGICPPGREDRRP